MKCVIIESPYAADKNHSVVFYQEYLNCCIRESLNRQEAPFASHGFYTRVLNDDNPKERELGIMCNFSWMQVANTVAFYIDHGFSPGMLRAFQEAQLTNKTIELRKLYP